MHNDSGEEYAAMKLLRNVSLGLIALAFVFVQTGRSFAEYPDKPIRLLLPFPAGGAVDIVARVMAATMAEDLGKPASLRPMPSPSHRPTATRCC